MSSCHLSDQPRFENGEAIRLVGFLERYDEASMGKVPLQWGRFNDIVGDISCRMGTGSFGLHYSLCASPPRFEYLSAVAVSDDALVPSGLVERNLPQRRYAVFSYAGHVSELGSLFTRIFEGWFPASGCKPAGEPLFCEVYGEDFDAATASGAVEVWVPLQE